MSACICVSLPVCVCVCQCISVYQFTNMSVLVLCYCTSVPVGHMPLWHYDSVSVRQYSNDPVCQCLQCVSREIQQHLQNFRDLQKISDKIGDL